MIYKPTPQDIAWMKNLIKVIRDGGTWAWPNAELIIKFNKAQKIATVLNDTVTNEQNEELLVAKEVFKAIDWEIVW